MHEPDAQAVLLVRAFEETDPEGRILSASERARATAAAREAAGEDEAALLAARARTLLPLLEEQVPFLDRVLSATRVGAGLGPLVLLAALAAGLASNALGPQQRIHVLFAPMLGLVAWNLAVYLVLFLFAPWWPWVRRPVDEQAAAERDPSGARRMALAAAQGTGRLVARLARWIVERSLRRPQARKAGDQVLVAAALGRYAGTWRVHGADLMAARLRRLLHLGSMALVLGAVAGMYVRGLGLRYGAVWESTFLEAEDVRAITALVLGPAAALLQRAVPDPTPLQQAPGDAAPWIHLWAVTGLLFILLPRTLLALHESRRIRRLAGRLPLQLGDAYFRRLLSPGAGAASVVDVLPSGLALVARARDTLGALLHDVFGSRADVRWHDPLEYGAEADEVRQALGGRGARQEEGGRHCLVLLLPLAQSPEAEVHGRLVGGLAGRLTAGVVLLVLVDGRSYRERLGGDSPRLAERRRAWERVLKEAGCTPVHVDLGLPVPDETVAALAAALEEAAR